MEEEKILTQEPEEVERADEILKRAELPSFCDNGITQCREKLLPGFGNFKQKRQRIADECFLRHGF